MNTRPLGTSDLHITPIGFGSWAIGGGGWAFAWGPQDDAQSIAAIHEALQLGINWIDTAAVYGLGHGEEVVGQALAGVRERPYVFTKCSRVWNDKREISSNIKAGSIRRECEASLRRLRLDVIDLYQMHWPNPEEDIEEGWAAMAQLKAEGKVRHIGLSNFNVPQLKRAAAIAPVTSLQPRFSLVHREIEAEVLPYCAANNIGVISYSPMGSGLLTGAMTRERLAAMPTDDFRTRHADFQEPQLSHNLALMELLRTIGQRHNRSPGEVAIAWVLSHPEITAAIVGARRPDQVRGTIGAADFRLSEKELAEIEQFQKQQPPIPTTQSVVPR